VVRNTEVAVSVRDQCRARAPDSSLIIDHSTLSRLVEAGAVRGAHEAAAYDAWFREQVQASIDDPRPSIPGEEVEARFAKKREVLRERMVQGHRGEYPSLAK